MGAITYSLDQRLLRLLRESLPLRVFVETGTYRGKSLQLAAPLFEECHSIELSPDLYRKAVERFADTPGVHLYFGESPELLLTLRPRFATTGALFWLDAHWCGSESAGDRSYSLLLEELSAIGELHPESVILIDDARFYLCPPAGRSDLWPDLHAVFEALRSLSSGHRLMIVNDVIIFYPERLRVLLSGHARENGVDWLQIVRRAYGLGRKLE